MSIQAKPLHSVGVAMKRKEDPRFIQGKGNYVDDLSFPGMLYLSLVRSTYPHAEIKNIDISEAMKVPGVKAVITGKDLEAAGLGWLPTFHGFDKQMVLAIGKVLFQYQEVAAVFAETRAAAVDGAEAVQVDYAPLPVVADPFTSKTDKVLLRPDRESKTNHIFHWEVGDKEGTARAMASSPKRIKQRIWFQRCHPAPLEPCGCVAYFDTMGRLQFHVTSQAPHVYRTALSLVTGIPEDKIHVMSPDLGGGFGNKVPVYPGYVCAIVGALKIGRPVKWIETRTENLTSTGFARDYHMDVEIGATADGKVTALHVATTADHGAFDAAADPTQVPGGHFRHRHRQLRPSRSPTPKSTPTSRTRRRAASPTAVRSASRKRATRSSAAWTSWPTSWAWMPWSCARRISSAKDQFPYPSALGFTYDSGDYHKTLDVALEKIGYAALLKEQAEKRARGELMGIGFSTFTEVVGAGPSKHFDILGIKMFDSAEIRIHPTGAGIVRTGAKSQGQGHETTWAQIVAEELGLDPQNIMVEEGDTDTAPYGLGTYASRSTPVAGAAIVMAARRIREKARKIAAHLLEVGEADVEWTDYKFQVKGVPTKTVTMKEVAFAAYTNMAQNEPGLEATYYYDPPNMTYPNGAYVAVVDVDRETGETKVRRFLAVDDCGVVINPMIVEGQIHGGLTEGFAMAFIQEIQYDAEGNNLNTNFTDYLVPTSLETPHWETANTVTPSPHHPMGAKGVGESPNVGSPAAFVNAVIDALSPLGVRHIDMPLTRDKVWRAIRDAEAQEGVRESSIQRRGEDPGRSRHGLDVRDRSREGRALLSRRGRRHGAGCHALRGRRQGRRRAGARQVQDESRAPARPVEASHRHEDVRRRVREHRGPDGRRRPRRRRRRHDAVEMERPGRSARSDRRRRRTRARRAGPEADRAGVRQRPPAVDGLKRPRRARCPGSRSASDSFRCTSPTMWIGSSSDFRGAVVFKAGTSDKTVDAWLVAQKVLEPRVDVAVGFIRLPEDRAGERSRERAHRRRAPQPAAPPVPERARALPPGRVRDRSRPARAAAARAPSCRGGTARSQRSGGHARAVSGPAVAVPAGHAA